MNSRTAWLLASAFMVLTAAILPLKAHAEVMVTDDSGNVIRLEHPARSVIALYGAFNEILGAMGLEDRIAARTRADVLPPCIKDKPVIGTHLRPNVELVAGIGPDLVLQSGGRKSSGVPTADLRRRGIPTAVFTPASFSELFSVIRRIGILTGSENKAEELIRSMQHRLEATARSIPTNASRPRVFFEIRHPNLLGAGAKSMVSDVIRKAGGANCLDADKKIVRLSEEELIRMNPDVYLVQRGPMNKNPSSPAARPHYRTLKAVQDGNIFFVDEQTYSRPGPRAVDAVEELAAILRNAAQKSNKQGPSQ